MAAICLKCIRYAKCQFWTKEWSNFQVNPAFENRAQKPVTYDVCLSLGIWGDSWSLSLRAFRTRFMPHDFTSCNLSLQSAVATAFRFSEVPGNLPDSCQLVRTLRIHSDPWQCWFDRLDLTTFEGLKLEPSPRPPYSCDPVQCWRTRPKKTLRCLTRRSMDEVEFWFIFQPVLLEKSNS